MFRSFESIKILIVDDSRVSLSWLKNLLEKNYYNIKVDFATDGKKTVDLIKKHKVKYDLIFLDYVMPKMDGIETLKKIRELGTSYAKEIPIIAVTVVDNKELFMQNGFQDYIFKPANIELVGPIMSKYIK